MKNKQNINKKNQNQTTMIKTLFNFTPSVKELYLLNQPFETLKRQAQESVDADERNLFRRSSISSYHDPLANEPNWFRYPNLYDLEIIIAGTDDPATSLSVQEILDFTVQNNGFSLSRDNLFMLWAVYYQELEAYVKETKKSFRIIAMAPAEMLPEHISYIRKICPLINICYDENLSVVKKLDYDWSWIDKPNNKPLRNFAFFKKKVV